MIDPYIVGRLSLGIVALGSFAHAAIVGGKTIAFFRVRQATEGQLALERNAELGATTAKVGSVALVAGLLSSALAADRLSPSLRGAMCGYGVVHANPWGEAAITSTLLAALFGLVGLELFAFDRRTRGLDLVRPLASFAMVGAVLSLADLVLSYQWLMGLDFSVVASCCSSGVDAGDTATSIGDAGPRTLAALATLGFGVSTAVAGVVLARRPSRTLSRAAGVLGLLLLPAFVAATALYVAPHVYEVPHHRCPYCLLKADAWFLGYGLFGAALVGIASAVGLALTSLLAPRDEDELFAAFARRRGSRTAVAVGVALSLGAFPVVRYLAISGGASLGP